MKKAIYGLVLRNGKPVLRDFRNPRKPVRHISLPIGVSKECLIEYLTRTYLLPSFRSYLLAANHLQPTPDTWDNLVFTGHAYGVYDHQMAQFRSARSLGMHAAEEIEIAYTEALQATNKSLSQLGG